MKVSSDKAVLLKEYKLRLSFASIQKGFLIPIGVAILLVGSPFGLGGNTSLAILLRNSVILMLLILWVVTSKEDSQIRFNCGIERLFLPFLLVCALSYIFSPYRFSTQLEIFQILLYTGFFYFLFNILNGPLIRKLFWAIVAGSCLQAGLAVVQHFLFHAPRAAGLFLNPNLAATYMLAGFSLALSSLARPGSSFFERSFSLGCLGLLSAGMASTGSRSLAISLPAVLLVWALFQNRGLWKGLAAGVLLCLALVVVPNPVGDRWVHEKQRDVYAFDRLKIWSQTMKILWDHPITGVTLGNYEYSTFRYRFPSRKEVGRYEKIFKDAHNSYLEIAAEIGILGSLLLIGMILVVTRRFFLAYRRAKTKDPEVEYYLRSSFLLITALSAQAFFHDVAHSPPNVLLGLFALGTILSEGLGLKEHYSPSSEITNSKWKDLLSAFRAKQTFFLYTSIILVVVIWPLFCLRIYLANNYYQTAFQNYLKQDLQNAKKVLLKAIFYNQNQPYYYRLLGDVFMQQFERRGNIQNINRAEAAFTTAVRLNSLDPELYYNLANFYHYLGKKMPNRLEFSEKAIRYYREAIALDPFRIKFRMRLTLIYMGLNRLKEARYQLEKCLELEPQFLAAMYLLKEVYRKMGEEKLKNKMARLMEVTTKKYRNYRPKSKYERMILLEPKKYFGEILGIEI